MLTSLGLEEKFREQGVDDCMRFIQAVLYAGNRNETMSRHLCEYSGSREKKTSMLLPPDEKSAKQAIYRVNYQDIYGFIVWKNGLNQFRMK